MEPSQQSSVRCIHSTPVQQRPILRLEAMMEKNSVAPIHQFFSAATSRAMNSKSARNRTTSESAVVHGKHAASTPLVFDQEI
ncbi:hypothetical protein Angca_001774, partial [Angiostrongylus cantonensis]